MTVSAEFLVLSSQGKTLKGSLSSLVDVKGRNVVDHCSELACANLPIGRYSYVVTAPDALPSVYRGDVLLVCPTAIITLSSGWGDRDGVSFPGNIRGVPLGARMWIHAHALVENRNLNARVADDGKFTLHGLLNDVYIISLLRTDGTILLSHSFTCCAGNRDGRVRLRGTIPLVGSDAPRLEFDDGFRPY